MSDFVSGVSSYRGTTTRESEMDLEGGETSCESWAYQDGVSVFDFGNLDHSGNPWVGYACWWGDTLPTPYITAVDIRLNTTDHNWTVTPGATACNEYYDVQSVATHEFGHAWGMAHVLEVNHPLMTMSTVAEVCNGAERTLGRGDILGMRAMY
jgi:hypothetical protein